MLHKAAPMLDEVGQQVEAAALRERLAATVTAAEAGPLPPQWPIVTVRGVSDPVRRAGLYIWFVVAAEAAGETGPYEVEVVQPGTWTSGQTTNCNGQRMRLHPDLLSQTEPREYLRLGWHVYSMVSTHELMRRGVLSDDALGALSLDLAAEWFTVSHFQQGPGVPMFRSAAAPADAGDVRALGSALGAALAGSDQHRQEVDAWLHLYGDSPLGQVARALLRTLANADSLGSLLDALAATYRSG